MASKQQADRTAKLTKCPLNQECVRTVFSYKILLCMTSGLLCFMLNALHCSALLVHNVYRGCLHHTLQLDLANIHYIQENENRHTHSQNRLLYTFTSPKTKASSSYFHSKDQCLQFTNVFNHNLSSMKKSECNLISNL